MSRPSCEGCGNKRAHFGTPEEGKKRWCGACGKAKGAISLTTQQMCEGCGNKHGRFVGNTNVLVGLASGSGEFGIQAISLVDAPEGGTCHP